MCKQIGWDVSYNTGEYSQSFIITLNGSKNYKNLNYYVVHLKQISYYKSIILRLKTKFSHPSEAFCIFRTDICSFSSGTISNSTCANTEAQRSGDFLRSPPNQQYGTGCPTLDLQIRDLPTTELCFI